MCTLILTYNPDVIFIRMITSIEVETLNESPTQRLTHSDRERHTNFPSVHTLTIKKYISNTRQSPQNAKVSVFRV